MSEVELIVEHGWQTAFSATQNQGGTHGWNTKIMLHILKEEKKKGNIGKNLSTTNKINLESNIC